MKRKEMKKNHKKRAYTWNAKIGIGSKAKTLIKNQHKNYSRKGDVKEQKNGEE